MVPVFREFVSYSRIKRMIVTPAKQPREMEFACYLQSKRYISPKQVTKDCCFVAEWICQPENDSLPLSSLHQADDHFR